MASKNNGPFYYKDVFAIKRNSEGTTNRAIEHLNIKAT